MTPAASQMDLWAATGVEPVSEEGEGGVFIQSVATTAPVMPPPEMLP